MGNLSHKNLALQALNRMRGDDLYRARAAFRNCTEEQMAEEYGQSGKTRTEILRGYEDHEANVLAAIEWLKALP